MNTPSPNVASGFDFLVDTVASAISDRPGLSEEQKQARAEDVRALVGMFQPDDPLQTILVGQAMLFNTLIADGAHDLLAGMQDTPKLRAQSNVNAMNRALWRHLTLFLRLNDKADGVPAAARPRKPRAAKPVVAPPAPEPVDPEPASTAETEPAVAAAPPSKEAESWIDAPYTTWVIETPAEARTREMAERVALASRDGRRPASDRRGRGPTFPAVDLGAIMAEQSAVLELTGAA